MPFDWKVFGDFIAKLTLLAMRFYMLVEGKNDDQELYRRRRQVAKVIDPDRPEESIEPEEPSGPMPTPSIKA